MYFKSEEENQIVPPLKANIQPLSATASGHGTQDVASSRTVVCYFSY